MKTSISLKKVFNSAVGLMIAKPDKSFRYYALITALGALTLAPVSAQYSVINEFIDGVDNPPANELVTDNNWIYGTTLKGGAFDYGYIFRMNLDGSDYHTLFAFDDPDIGTANTSISLTIFGAVIFGTIDKGGLTGDGMIFRIDTDGSGYSKLHDFGATDGRFPSGKMTVIDTFLIGTTSGGGNDEAGTVYKFNMNENTLEKIHDFDSINGASPTGGLLQSDSSLYGLTTHGGLNSNGVLYKINPDGSGFENVHDFIDSTGSHPMGSLVQIDSSFYGTCSSGGENSVGNVFRIKTTGEDYESLVDFDGLTGNSPRGSLTLVGNRIYGTTYSGGAYDLGALFTLYADSPEIEVLFNFNAGSGFYPEATLIAGGSWLFGTTIEGGTNDGGVLFGYETGYPGEQSSYLGFGYIQPGQMDLDWWNGTGESRIVFMKKDSIGIAYPKNGISYTDSSRFGYGSQIDNSGWYCVYKGTDEWVQVTGLVPGTAYRAMVLEFNGSEGNEKYLISTSNNNPLNQATRPGVPGYIESSSSGSLHATSFAYSRDIMADGCIPMVSHGSCWAIHPSPTLADSVHIDGSEIGAFNTLIGHQEPNTTYYWRFFIIYPSDTIYGDEVSFTTRSVESSITRAYDMLMPLIADYDFGSDPNDWVFGSIVGGDANKGSDDGDQPAINPIQSYEVSPENEYMFNKWKVLYDGITICNDAIVAVVDSLLSDPVKDILVAELSFLRAFYYFELIKLFGPELPWNDETNWLNDEPVPNDSPIWSQVENDFLNAISDLPDVSSTPGRVNVWAAKAFYAKLLLYQQKYAEALAVFNDVINNGKTTSGDSYALLANFDNNFNILYNNSSESVFAQQAEHDTLIDEISYWLQNLKANPGYMLAYPYGPDAPGGCCGFFQPSQSLVNSFQVDGSGLPMFDPSHAAFPFNLVDLKHDDGILSNEPFYPDSVTALDPRLDWTVGRRGIPYLDWGIHPGNDWIRDQAWGGPYSPIKNVFRAADTLTGRAGTCSWAPGSELNHNLMRFADVLLMAAECEVELGNFPGALGYVNQVRTRASISRVQNGGSDAANYQVGIYPFFPSDQYAREAVRFERKLELAMEGHRFFDLARWGGDYAEQELDSGYLAYESVHRAQFAGADFDTCDLYFPIPQSITFYLPREMSIDDPPLRLRATSTSGMPISFFSSDPGVVQVIGDSLYIVGPGTTSVSAYQSINEDCQGTIFNHQDITITDMSTLLDVADLSCETGTLGSIDLTVVGGLDPYTYLWSNGSTGEDITDLYAGVYYVSVTDIQGCTIMDTADIVNEGTVILNLPDSAEFCSGDSTVISGPAGYDQYLWSTGAVDTNQIMVNSTGNYWLQVIDSLMCTGMDIIAVIELPDIDIQSAIVEYDCEMGTRGSIDLAITGGTEPYTFLWSNDSTSEDISELLAGQYYVVVTDSKTCIGSDTITLVNSGSIPLNLSDIVEFCQGESIMLNGPVGYVQYEWSATAIDTYQIQVDTAGTFWVEVTDNLGCTGRDTIVVIELAAMSFGTAAINYDCETGTAGSIDISVTGGTSPYTFLWSDSSDTEDLSGLYPGDYIVTVTDSKNCYKPDTITIETEGYLVINMNEDSIEFCIGETGVIIAPTGYSNYTWSNGISDTNQITVDGTGIITLVVADTISCVSEPDTVVVIEHPIPSAPVAEDKSANQDATIPDLTATGDNIKWYAAADSSYLGEGPSYATGETAAGTYNYLVTKSQNNCESPYTEVSLIINVPPVSIQIPDTTICPGNTVTYQVADLIGHAYFWIKLNPWETISTTGRASLSPGVTSDYVYKDSTTSTGIVAIDTFRVTVEPKPVFSAKITTNPIEVGNNTSVALNPVNDYIWSPDDPVLVVHGVYNVSPEENTDYTITGTTTAGCVGDTVISLYVFCGSCLDSTYFYSAGDLDMGCTNRNYRNGADCQWIIYPPGATWIKIVFDTADFDIKPGDWIRVYEGSDASGTLKGTYDNENLPVDTIAGGSELFLHFHSNAILTGAGFNAEYYSNGTLHPIAIEDIMQDIISIYPNPTSGTFSLEISQASFKEAELEIFSTLGHEVLNKRIQAIDGSINEEIELSDLPQGVYYLRILTKKNVYTKTIIRE